MNISIPIMKYKTCEHDVYAMFDPPFIQSEKLHTLHIHTLAWHIFSICFGHSSVDFIVKK